MFQLTQPTPQSIQRQLALVRDLPPACPDILSLQTGLGTPLPPGFSHDQSRSMIGRGETAFTAARKALSQWRQFDLGWVRVTNSTVSITHGELVAVEIRAAGLWSLNLSRITHIVDSPTRFGFLYATTAHHVEEGQERFVLEYDPAAGDLFYLIEAVSRPRHPLARLAWPYARAMQHRFARDSHARMRHAVTSSAP